MQIPIPGDIKHTLAAKYCFKIFQIKFFLNTKNTESGKFFGSHSINYP